MVADVDCNCVLITSNGLVILAAIVPATPPDMRLYSERSNKRTNDVASVWISRMPTTTKRVNGNHYVVVVHHVCRSSTHLRNCILDAVMVFTVALAPPDGVRTLVLTTSRVDDDCFDVFLVTDACCIDDDNDDDNDKRLFGRTPTASVGNPANRPSTECVEHSSSNTDNSNAVCDKDDDMTVNQSVG